MDKTAPAITQFWFNEFETLFSVLPAPEKSCWTPEERKRWLTAFISVLDMLIAGEER